jgi:threonine/homoserine/homoserine lactone efflux protein
VILVAAGVGALLQRSQHVFDLLKLAGAVYLVHLGVQTFRHRHELALASRRTEVPRPARRMVRDGVVVSVTNPKGFVMCAALLPQFVDPSLGHPQLQLLILGSICVAIGLASDSIWGLAAGSARAWLGRSPQRLAAVGGAGGLATVGLGVRLAVSGRHD